MLDWANQEDPFASKKRRSQHGGSKLTYDKSFQPFTAPIHSGRCLPLSL
jgi:hypothetical protein